MRVGVFSDRKSEIVVSGSDKQAAIARPVKPEYTLVRGSSEVSILASGQISAAPPVQSGSTAIVVSTRGLLDFAPQAPMGGVAAVVVSATATITAPSLAPPTISPVSGTSVPVSGGLTVTITPGIGTTLNYTLDGSDVTAVGNTSIRTSNTAVSLVVPSGQAASYQARSSSIQLDGGGLFSAVVFASYEPAGQLATPVFTPSSGPALPVSVSVVDPADSDVWYTTDPGTSPAAQGATPVLPWRLYSAPISVTTTTMLRAQGRDHSTKSNSQVATAVYGLAVNTVSLGFVRRNANRAGIWGEFTAQPGPGEPGYVDGEYNASVQFNFFANFAAPVTIHVLMFVNKGAQASNLWSTWRRPIDVNLAAVTGGTGGSPDGREVYPTVLDFAGAQLRFSYASPAANLMLDGQLWPGVGFANNPVDPVGNLGNYNGLVAFSCFANGVTFAPNQTMKVVLYASPVGSTVITRYWAECLVP